MVGVTRQESKQQSSPAARRVPAAQLKDRVQKLAGVIAQEPLPAVRGVKEYAGTAFDMPLAGAIDFAKNLHAVVGSSSEQ